MSSPLKNDVKLVCYSTKGGKDRKSARNQWQSENPYRMYWEDVPPQLYTSVLRIRSSFGARNPKWLTRHLKWEGCGRAVAFGRVDPYGRSVGTYEGHASFRRCSNKTDDTGFCKRHKSSAVIDGKVTSKNLVVSKLLAWLPHIYKRRNENEIYG